MKKTLLIALALALTVSLAGSPALANEKSGSETPKTTTDKGDHQNFAFWTTAMAKLFNRSNVNANANIKLTTDKNQTEKENSKKNEKRDPMMMGGVVHITALSNGDQITAERPSKSDKSKSDKTLTINTTDKTTFLLRNGDEATFKDLSVGDWIMFSGTLTEKSADKNVDNVTLTASKIRILGDIDISSRAKVTGEVINSPSAADNQLTIKTDDNQTVTINADDFTKIKDEDGNKITLSDITAGMSVKIKGWWNSVMNTITAWKIKVVSS